MESSQEQTFVTSRSPQEVKPVSSASKYLNSSLLLNQLTERVYELLQEDLRSQRERVSNYAQNRWL
ncbi:hypothetical protein [Calothrix rhizosoleniae]|uniref:hypothetical protein n=1 Tax=Calothrix rhizosoleniae TaxID=888997 RepID=UPI000B4A40A3|nr:hypothetical protein [Calothrix rhizosoleniae]